VRERDLTINANARLYVGFHRGGWQLDDPGEEHKGS
jgi:hypothetical protein